MKRFLTILVLLGCISLVVYGQSRGTPNQLNIITDANGSIVAAGVAQVLPLSQPTVFSNARLATDSSGNLQVALTSGGGSTVTNHAYYIGTGTSSTTAVGPCTTNQVPHGVTGADPACGSILEAYLGLTDLTTANATASAHGFMPKLSGNAYDFVLGNGTYGQTVAAGTITTNKPWTFTQTWNDSMVNFHGIDINITRTAHSSSAAYFQISNGSGNVLSIYAGGTEAATNKQSFVQATGAVLAQHYLGNGDTPAVTNTSANSCGTTAATNEGTDVAGRVTVGATSGTSCTITFDLTYQIPPFCVAANETSGLAVKAVASATTVILSGTFAAADKLIYMCAGW